MDQSLAQTEESRLVETAREVGAQTATPAQLKRVEVPSRAARVNGVFFQRKNTLEFLAETSGVWISGKIPTSPRRSPSVTVGANRLPRLLVEERIMPMINLGGTAGE